MGFPFEALSWVLLRAMLKRLINAAKAMGIRREDKLEQLERILHSRAMQGSENLKSFLKFIVLKCVDESKDLPKEYVIATEVFGRSDDFSPRSDSIVRVQASRLRSKLQEYYATEGRSDKILIDLPKGHYHPVFSITSSTDGPQSALASPHTDGSRERVTSQPVVESFSDVLKYRRLVKALAVAVVVLIIAVVFLAMSNRSQSFQPTDASTRNDIQKFGLVWDPFLRDGDQTLVVLSNPAVFRFTNPMDADALLKDAVTLTPSQANHVNRVVGDKFMIKHSRGRLVLCTDEYTGMGEAIGLARITDLFRTAGRASLLKQSRTVSPEDLKNHNVITLGSVWVNEWSGKLPIDEQFTYTPTATIENANPQPGEEREYGPKFDSAGRLIEDYGLITVKPNISYRNAVMVVAGIHSEGTQAAAEYLTNIDYLTILNDRLRQLSGSSGPPRYYQALLRVAVDNGMPTTISLISVHELKA